MFQFTLKTVAQYIAADPSAPKEILNNSGSDIFYKNARDVDSGDTKLEAGQTAVVTEGVWVVSAFSSEVGIRELENLQVRDNLSVAGTSLLTGKVHAVGEVEIDGDLNHDGAKIGFFGTAPVAKKNVKPAAEVNAKELCEALEAYGLLE